MALSLLALAEEDEATAAGGDFGIGSFVLVLVIVGLLLWMGYLFLNSRRSRAAIGEPTPLNQTPYMSDDELENDRTTRVLRAAVVAAALLAVVLPWYAFNEADRTAAATEELAQVDIDAGKHWYETFACVTCHGEDLGGGAAEFVEPRSGVITNWIVPSLNDVLYRYDESEVRFVIEYGRLGTPMPANGLDGGGSMTVQEIDQLIAYIGANQIPQAEVVAKGDRNAALALLRIESGEEATQARINQQQARIDRVTQAGATLTTVGAIDVATADLLGGAGTCTEASAALVLATCDQPGFDTDRDGLSDSAELQLTEIAALALENLTELGFNSDGTANLLQQDVYDVAYDPADAFTNTDPAGLPVADLDTAELMLAALESDVLLLTITAEKEADFLAPLDAGMAFLEEAAALRLWEVDFAAVSEAMSEVSAASEESSGPVSLQDAERAVGLFNANCARCHTGGYSAGATFETGAGSGAWGPAIDAGRAVIQFPDLSEHLEFIVNGTTNAGPYGVNGIGTGRMPGFGTSLSAADIRLIALYERTL